MKNPRLKAGIILSALLMMTASSCNNQEDATINLRENEDQKEEVFDQILNDDVLFNDFINSMMLEDNTMQWMMEDGEFMHHMFSGDRIDYMMQHNRWFNSDSMRNIMQEYYNDSTMMHHEGMMHNR